MSDQRYVVSGETMYTNIKENIILETRLKFIYYLISYITIYSYFPGNLKTINTTFVLYLVH